MISSEDLKYNNDVVMKGKEKERSWKGDEPMKESITRGSDLFLPKTKIEWPRIRSAGIYPALRVQHQEKNGANEQYLGAIV